MFILIIEDDLWIYGFLKKELENNGYTNLMHFDNGLQGLQQVYEGRVPDVIILDYNLEIINDSNGQPVTTETGEKLILTGYVNGVEVLQKVKAYRPDVRVIFFSSQSEVTVAVDAIKKGAREYINKDDPDKFIKIIKVLKEIEIELNSKGKKKPVKKFLSGLKDFLVNND